MTPYYDEGGITIYHGDGLETWPLDPGLVDVVTDPPYGVGVDYGGAFNDKRADYWDWMRAAIEVMRANASTVTFTHRLMSLRELRDWDDPEQWDPDPQPGICCKPLRHEDTLIAELAGEREVSSQLRAALTAAKIALVPAMRHPMGKCFGTAHGLGEPMTFEAAEREMWCFTCDGLDKVCAAPAVASYPLNEDATTGA